MMKGIYSLDQNSYARTGASRTKRNPVSNANRLLTGVRKIVLMCSLCIPFLCNESYAQVGTWTAVTATAPHFNDGVMLLLTDGTVLCKNTSGGGNGLRWDRLTPDAHGSYINGTWSTIADMFDDRLYFSSQVLPDGRVYVAGGEYGSGGPKSEVWNPRTNTWTRCPQVVTGSNISDANSELLYTGKVLQAIVDTGGTRLNFLYNPATNTYAPTGSCLRTDNEGMWVKLPDNTVVFNDNYGTTSERYNPVTGTWINDGTLPVSLYDPFGEEAGAGFLLPNGKVYFIGSNPTSAFYTPTGTLSPGTWTAGPALPNGWGAPDAASAMMVNGKVLLCLSPAPSSADHFPDTTAFFEFDYTTNTYTALLAPGSTSDTVLGTPSYFSNMLCLPDGSILFCNQYDNQYYEYMPGTPALAAGKPTVSSVIEQNCDSFTITGTLFNGITEGAGYGDDWQMYTNYPIVRLTSGSNVYYCTTSNWNRIGAVMTGALPDTAQFKLPAGLPVGTYNLQVVVNGNPSANFPFSTVPNVVSTSTSTICAGTTTLYSSTIGSGTWSTSNTAVATINPTSGLVTGVSGLGTATITYSLGLCNSFSSVTVNAAPAAIVPLAATSICVGSSAALSDATGSGTWASSNSSVATVDFIGNTTGISNGSATITYTAAGCSVYKSVTVNPLPGPITGNMTLCTGSSTPLSDGGGGTWTSSSSSVATVGLGSGVVSGLSFGTSNIVYTLGTGCNAMATVTVNTSPGAITGTMVVCVGSTTALSDGGLGTWSSANTSVATVGLASGIVSGMSQGTATISYTLGGSCSSIAVVTVNPLPSSITGTPNVCIGSTTALSDAGGGTWLSSNTAVATVGSGSGVVSGSSSGVSLIVYTLPTGCAANVPVTVNSLPSAITGTATVCAGQTTLLSDGSLGGGWSSANTSVATVSGGTVTGVTAGTAIISYTFGTGCAATAVVTVNQSPAVITGNPDLCIGLTTSLADFIGPGAWTSGNTSIATVDGFGTVTGVAAGTSTITYALLDGCSTTSGVVVHNPPAPLLGAAAFCTGSTINLTETVPGGTWSSSSTSVATVGSTGIVTGVTLGTADIIYTLGAGCTASATVTVSTGPSPITGTTTLCTGAGATLSDATPLGAWTSTNTAVATISGTGDLLGVTAGTSTVSYSLGAGCATTSVVNIITSTAGAITGSTTVCVGQNTALTDATPTGVWSSGSTGIATVSAGGVVTGVSAGPVTIFYTVTNACGTAVTSQAMTVNALPTVAAITGSANVCISTTSALTDATPSGAWSSGSPSIATVSPSGLVTGVALGSASIVYTVTSLAGCSASTFMTVLVSSTAPAITGTPSVCPGTTTALSDPSGGGVWSSSNTAIATVGATSGIVTGVAPGFPVITYIEAGCTATTTVTVNTLPTLHSITGGGSYCSGGTGVPVGLNSSDIGVNYELYNGTTLITTMAGISGSLSFGLQTLAGTYTVVAVNGSTGCTNNMVGSVVITITPPSVASVSINASPGDTICAGGHVTFTAIPVFGGPSPSYQWTKNGVNSGTGPTYTPVPIPNDKDAIGCTMTSDYTCLASATPVSSALTIHVEAASLNLDTVKVTRSSITSGEIDTFVVVAPHAGATPTYQWFLNGLPIPGATNATYITSTLVSTDIVKCQVTSSDPCTLPKTNFSNGVKVQIRTGINNVANGGSNFNLVPNPNKGQFTISGFLNNPGDDRVSIIVTDMLGQTIYSEVAQANNGLLSKSVVLGGSVASGIYLVKITYGEDHEVFRVVVEK